jgi:alpha-glucuronidase
MMGTHKPEKYAVMKKIILFLLLTTIGLNLFAENGHDLWLRGKSSAKVNVVCKKSSPTILIATQELQNGWQGKNNVTITLTVKADKQLKHDGYKISGNEIIATTDFGILYGVYDLLRHQQTGQVCEEIASNPSYEERMLDHWDNPNGTIERGYAGRSIFWRTGENAMAVTDNDLKLWKEYARANASIGINGAVLNNVNASPQMLSKEYIERVKAIAGVLRPYGIKTYLSVNFSSPKALGKLKTSDPLDPEVIKWWNDKVKEIYSLVPDFGGFLVKASSEGQPGPQDFGRTHVDGANVMADALKPFGGIVMWRAFVYSPDDPDRAKQAYNEFVPFDGKFRDNVIIQVKNGPVDFQPREPFSPLFGALKKTSVMPEFQITQEYLGQSIHLVFLGTMWEECLKSETYQEGPGSTVARCTDGSIYPQQHTAISGVSNIGLDSTWCGHIFSQANWYAYGRLAWNNTLSSETIADEWIRLTFASGQPASNLYTTNWEENFLTPVMKMMLESREAAVNYMMPLGLHHQFSANEHYGPGPWYGPRGVRKDWTPPYYHKADSAGIGFDRTHNGTDAVSQYHEPLGSQLNDLSTCPDKYLLWFHHLPWDYKMRSGRTLWDEICIHYETGLTQVRDYQKIWDRSEPYLDKERFVQVQHLLREQYRNAQIWKDGCLLYFQQFSKRPIPYDIERPAYNLDILIKSRNFKTL